MSTAEALCIKNTLTDQIGLGRLISKHEMFCFEKTVFKTLNFFLNILYFEKQYKLYGLNLVCTKVVNNTI
jgi:uncharacterized integral membrane protein